MSHVRCMFSAANDMTINICLPYSMEFIWAYDAMFAHDSGDFRLRSCTCVFGRHSLCVCAVATFAQALINDFFQFLKENADIAMLS